jgi:HEAT repeat protein
MGKPDRTEQALERLSTLKTSTDDAPVVSELKRFLSDRSNLVVAKAAKVVRERSLVQLVPELVNAFQKLMSDAPRLDKRCAAVTEIAMALYEMDYIEPDVYRQGLKHVQMEASFGPPIDVAATLRGICAQGLVRTRYPHALEEVVALLVDKHPPARLGAVKALATNGGEAGALALRLKALTGDADVEVMAECFSGLLSSRSETAVDFVADFADTDDSEVGEAATLALGASRVPKALEFLKEKWQRSVQSATRKTILLALATSRDEVTLSFLIAQVNEASLQTAAEITTALAVHKNNDRIRQLVSEAVDRRRERALLDAFRREFTE